MPAVDYRPPSLPARDAMLRELFNPPSAGHDDVLDAIQALRREVADLRHALEPPRSPLITGREAVEAFKRLQRGAA